MSLFYPDAYFQHITDIPGSFFAQRQIRLIILDVDNTLTSHNHPVPFPGVQQWIEDRKNEGLTLVILSNNTNKRVRPFASLIGLPFVANAAKPLTVGISRTCRKYRIPAENACLIGDQLFTDILGGNWKKGLTSILVSPWEMEKKGFLAVKRKWEKPILHRYFAQNNQK